MAETSKRTSSSSTSKSRKSKSDIIRSKLGTYLKQNKYSMSEKFRKSELSLTQSLDQYDMDRWLDEDSAKVNLILYSNVACLSNNQSTVELQFSRFLKFIQSQAIPMVKAELQTLLWPLLCHIYIEMIKGRDPRPASEFLRKYASLIGPVENLYSPIGGGETNGLNSAQSEAEKDIAGFTLTTSPATQIVYAKTDADAESNATKAPSTMARKNDIELNLNDIRDYFKELIQSLSLCLRMDDINSIDIARNFRSAKYEMVLSLRSLYAMKQFLAESGHVIILHILQVWFSLDIREFINESEKESDEDMDDESIDGGDGDCSSSSGFAGNNSTTHEITKNGIEHHGNDGNSFDFCDTSAHLSRSHTEIRNLVKKVESEIRTTNGLNKFIPGDKTKRTDPFSMPLPDPVPAIAPECKTFNVVQNKYLQNVRAAVMRTRKLDLPMRIFNVVNAENSLSACDIDVNQCHLVCGLNDSTIKLWQLNQSKMRGRKPFSPFSNRLCEWSLENCESGSSSSSDDEYDYVKQKKSAPALGLFARQRPSIARDKFVGITYKSASKAKQEHKREFFRQRYDGNVFNDGGCVALRGHSKGVTDILFSRYNPLIYSVSKDKTMRAWKATDYNCGAVYRGHNYPIWCVAESSNGLYIATGGRDLTARLWSTDRVHPLQTYIGHTQDVDAIAFHPNGNYIATGSTDLTVRLWDFTSGKQTRVFIDCHLPVHCVSFSPDGRYLAAGGDESKIRIFDLAAGSQINELRDHSAEVNSIVWNSNSTKLASCCSDGTVRVFSVNKTVHTTSNSNANTPTASTSTPSSSSSSSSLNSSTSASTNNNSNTNKLLISSETGCRRTLKVFFNVDDTISCIGTS